MECKHSRNANLQTWESDDVLMCACIAGRCRAPAGDQRPEKQISRVGKQTVSKSLSRSLIADPLCHFYGQPLRNLTSWFDCNMHNTMLCCTRMPVRGRVIPTACNDHYGEHWARHVSRLTSSMASVQTITAYMRLFMCLCQYAGL